MYQLGFGQGGHLPAQKTGGLYKGNPYPYKPIRPMFSGRIGQFSFDLTHHC